MGTTEVNACKMILDVVVIGFADVTTEGLFKLAALMHRYCWHTKS